MGHSTDMRKVKAVLLLVTTEVEQQQQQQQTVASGLESGVIVKKCNCTCFS